MANAGGNVHAASARSWAAAWVVAHAERVERSTSVSAAAETGAAAPATAALSGAAVGMLCALCRACALCGTMPAWSCAHRRHAQKLLVVAFGGRRSICQSVRALFAWNVHTPHVRGLQHAM